MMHHKDMTLSEYAALERKATARRDDNAGEAGGTPYIFRDLSEIRSRIMEYLTAHPWLSVSNLSRDLNFSPQDIRGAATVLEKRKLIKRDQTRDGIIRFAVVAPRDERG